METEYQISFSIEAKLVNQNHNLKKTHVLKKSKIRQKRKIPRKYAVKKNLIEKISSENTTQQENLSMNMF